MPPLVCGQLASCILSRLNELRRTRTLCDCHIVIRHSTTDNTPSAFGDVLLVHRIVLCAVSPYFRAILTTTINGGATDQSITPSIIDLTAYPANAVQAVVDFIYTGELNLKDADPRLVLAVANHCQITPLQQMLTASHTPSTQSLVSSSPLGRIDSPPVLAQSTELKRKSQDDTKPQRCATHFLANCFKCVSTPKHQTTASDTVSSLAYEPPIKRSPPSSPAQVQPLNLSNLSDTSTWLARALAAQQMQLSSMLGAAGGSPLLTGSVPQASPMTTSGIHSAVSTPKRTTTAAAATTCRSQGVRTSPSYSADKSYKLVHETDEGWCRNKKYIERVTNGYMCTVCNKVYGRYNSVSYHVTIYHRNPPIKCDEPGCQFTTREARYIHFHKYYRHAIALPESIDLGTRSCPFCRHISKSPAMLEKHIRRHGAVADTKRTVTHLNGTDTRPTVIEASPGKRTPHQDSGHGCDKCSYRTQSVDALEQHKLFKHTESTFPCRHSCDQCDYRTSNDISLRVHYAQSHGLELDLDTSALHDQALPVGDGDIEADTTANDSQEVVVDGSVEQADTSSPCAPPPSQCSNNNISDTNSPVINADGLDDQDISVSEADQSTSSLEDEHSQLAATHTTGYHSMVNYGTV